MKALLDSVLEGEPEAEVQAIRRRLGQEADEEDEDPDGDGEDCPIELLRVLRDMDMENKQHFQDVIQHATKLLEKRSAKERKTRATRAAAPRNTQEEAASGSAAAEAPAAPPGDAEPPAAAAPANPDEVPAAHPHAGSHAARPRAGRKQTPDSLSRLLPPLDEDRVYLKWKSKKSQIQVEFIGDLINYHMPQSHCQAA